MSSSSSLSPLMRAVAHNSPEEIHRELAGSSAHDQARALDAAVAFRLVAALEVVLPHVPVADQPQLWPHAIDKGWADVVQRLAPHVDLYANNCENLILALDSGQSQVIQAVMTVADPARFHESVVRTAVLRGQLNVVHLGWGCVPNDQHPAMVMLAARSQSPATLAFVLGQVSTAAVAEAGETLSRDVFLHHLDALGEQAPLELVRTWVSRMADPVHDLPRTAARLNALDRHAAAEPVRPHRVRSRSRA